MVKKCKLVFLKAIVAWMKLAIVSRMVSQQFQSLKEMILAPHPDHHQLELVQYRMEMAVIIQVGQVQVEIEAQFKAEYEAGAISAQVLAVLAMVKNGMDPKRLVDELPTQFGME